MGRPRLKIEEWFRNEEKQLAWTRNYLTGRYDRAAKAAQWDYYTVAALLNTWQENAEGRERLTRMQRAWSQATSKAKGNKQTFTYKLSRDAAKRLLKIAEEAEVDKSAALERLINQDAEARARAKEELKQAIAAKRAELERQPGQGLTPAQLKDLRWAEKYKAANELLEERIAALLHENCEQWVVLVDLEHENKILTKNQQDRALLRYKDLMKAHNKAMGKANRQVPEVTIDTSIAGASTPSIFTEDGELAAKLDAQPSADTQAPDQLEQFDQHPHAGDNPSST